MLLGRDVRSDEFLNSSTNGKIATPASAVPTAIGKHEADDGPTTRSEQGAQPRAPRRPASLHRPNATTWLLKDTQHEVTGDHANKRLKARLRMTAEELKSDDDAEAGDRKRAWTTDQLSVANSIQGMRGNTLARGHGSHAIKNRPNP